MTSLFVINNNRFDLNMPDVTRYRKLEQFTNASVNLLDRTGNLIPPFKMIVPDFCALPDFDPSFSMTYEECCQDRAREILQKQSEIDKPILVFYSGGIDSSLALISFIKEIGQKQAEKRIKIVMSGVSIDENPWLWQRVLRQSNFEIVSSENHQSLYRDNIIVTGEFNDQLHGSDMYRQLIAWKGDSILNDIWNEDMIRGYLQLKMPDDPDVEFWVMTLINIVNRSPCQVHTMADFWWWINFSAKWTTVFWRMLLFADNPSYINRQWITNNYMHFFGSQNFQKWSMVNRTQKHKGNWLTYKWHARDLVCQVAGQEYGMKTKRGSLWEIVKVKKKADAIDDNFNFYYDINPLSWYNINNHFHA